MGRRRLPRATSKPAKEKRREAILDAAMRCFASQGYERTTTDEIARAAGCSKGALYHYFPGKKALLLALLDRWYVRAQGRFAAAIESSGDPARRLDAVVDFARWFDEEFVSSFRVAASFWLQGGPSELREAVLARERRSQVFFRRFLSGLLRTAGTSSRVGAIAAEDLATILFALLDGCILYSLVSAEEFPVERMTRTLQLVLHRSLGYDAPPGENAPEASKAP